MTNAIAADPILVSLQEDWQAKAIAEKHLLGTLGKLAEAYEKLKADAAEKDKRIAELEAVAKPQE